MNLKNPDYPPIPQRRRELYFRVIDSYVAIDDITIRLYFLDDHFPPDKLERALNWLIKNDLVGRKFVDWFKGPCKGSDLELQRMLIRVVDNEPLGKLIAGKNFRL